MKKPLNLLFVLFPLCVTGCRSIVDETQKGNEPEQEDKEKDPSTRKEYLNALNTSLKNISERKDLQFGLYGAFDTTYNFNETAYLTLTSPAFEGKLKASDIPSTNLEGEELKEKVNDIKASLELKHENLQVRAHNEEETEEIELPGAETNLYFKDFTLYGNFPNEITDFIIDQYLTEEIEIDGFDIDKIKEYLDFDSNFKLPFDLSILDEQGAIDFSQIRLFASMYFQIYNEIYSEIFEFSGENGNYYAKIPLNYKNVKFIYDLHKTEDSPILEEEDFEKFLVVDKDSTIDLHFTSTAIKTLEFNVKGSIDLAAYNELSENVEENALDGTIDFDVDLGFAVEDYEEIVMPEDIDDYQDISELIEAYEKIKEFINQIN